MRNSRPISQKTKNHTMKGKEFESLCKDRAKKEKDLYHMRPYGVKAVFESLTHQWRPVYSNPDFEGIFGRGRQFVFDAKVISGSKLDHMNDSASKVNQREFMLHRWALGCPAFFLVHCVERTFIKKETQPEQTWAMPCDPDMDIWKSIASEKKSSISRDELEEFGSKVTWDTVNPADRNPLPDFFSAVLEFAKKIDK